MYKINPSKVGNFYCFDANSEEVEVPIIITCDEAPASFTITYISVSLSQLVDIGYYKLENVNAIISGLEQMTDETCYLYQSETSILSPVILTNVRNDSEYTFTIEGITGRSFDPHSNPVNIIISY